MKSHILPISVLTASVCAGLTCLGQGSLPTPGAPGQPAATPPATSEAGERAEDAALLQQLDSDTQQKTEPRHKGNNSAAGVFSRGGGMGIAAPAAVPFHTQNLITRSGGSSKPVIVRSSESDPKSQAALEEDLAVMSHLLNKSLEDLPGGPAHGNKVMGIDVFFTGSAPLHTLYLDNYGALFFLNVNFPLLAPAEKHGEEKPTGDTAWEEARQELYGQRGPGEGAWQEEYSQEKVDRLKDTLFESLKNAINIRGLKSDDFVTICVSGGTSAKAARVRAGKNQPGAMAGSAIGGNVFAADAAPRNPRRTVMTLRARKSEIDDYAKGKLTPEEFQKHAQLTAYTADPVASASDNMVISYSPEGRYIFQGR